MFKPDKPYNDLPLLPPKKGKVETIAILKQEANRSGISRT